MTVLDHVARPDALSRAGLPQDSIAAWLDCNSAVSGDYRRDAEDFSRQWRIGAELIAQLPQKPSRSEAQSAAAAAIFTRLGLVDRQTTAVDFLVVQALDGRLRLSVAAHLHEAEALGAAGVPVHDDLSG